MLSRYASPSNISSAFGRGYGAAAIGLSISVVSKRGCLPSLGYLVHNIADVDGGFSQPAQCYEALIFLAADISSGIFPAARSHDFADQLTVGWFVRWSHDFFAFSPISTRRRMASGRLIFSPCASIQSSIASNCSSCMRTTCGSPGPVVLGRPIFGLDFVESRTDLAIHSDITM